MLIGVNLFSILLNLGLIFCDKNLFVSNSTGSDTDTVGKLYYLSDLFTDSIRFNDFCIQDRISTIGSQFVKDNSESNYFNYERIYYDAGNEISIMFHFLDTEERLYQQVWEKYLLNYSLHASENMFFTIKVLYNGEEYRNTKLIRRIPLTYDLYSDIEMNKVDYEIKPLSNCQHAFGKVINVQINLAGTIYNETKDRAIVLDDTRFLFQIAPFDTAGHEIPKNAVVYKPVLDKRDPVKEFLDDCVQNEDVYEGEIYHLPCLRWKGKPYLIHKKSYMIFRLPPEDFKRAFSMEGTLYFNPNGHEMPSTEWIQIPYYYRDKWPEFASIALEYIKL